MPATPRFELFSFWRSSATYRVRVALNLKGLEAAETLVDLDAGAGRDPDFLLVNPLGALPVLIDRDGLDAAPITQSLAILEFLDELHPSPPLLPAGAHARARVRSLAGMLASDTHPLIVPRVRHVLQDVAGWSLEHWRDWQRHWLTLGLRAVEQRLAREPATGRFCHGDTPTLADICLASLVVVQRVFRIEIDAVPTVERIMAACESLDAFRRADPGRQRGAPS